MTVEARGRCQKDGVAPFRLFGRESLARSPASRDADINFFTDQTKKARIETTGAEADRAIHVKLFF
jgi:hypothetical protein